MALLRYQPDGSLDPSFGTGGKVTNDFGGNGTLAESLTIQNDGKIIVGGTGDTQNSDAFTVIRLNPVGSLDDTFGSGGRVLTRFRVRQFGLLTFVMKDIILGSFVYPCLGHQGIAGQALVNSLSGSAK